MNDPRDVARSARRWWALAAIAASVLVVGLDLTVLNLALPSMANDLHASTGQLIVARAVLGIGAAAIFPLTLSVLPVLFTREEQPRAVAAIAGATMLSFPIGPIVGGYLLTYGFIKAGQDGWPDATALVLIMACPRSLPPAALSREALARGTTPTRVRFPPRKGPESLP